MSMSIDLKIQDNRANLFTDLRKFQVECLSNLVESDLSFETLLGIWDVTSEVLWALGYWQDYIRCAEITLRCAAQLKKLDIEGRILNELGWAQMEQENFKMAQIHFSRSLQIFRETGDRISQGQSLRYMGVLYFRRRYLGSSLKYYQESLRISQEGLKIGPQDSDKQRLLHQQAEIHNLLGNLYFKLWNVNACRRELVAGLQGFRTLQKLYVSPTPSYYLYYQPVLLLNLGRIAMLRRQYGKAQHYFDRCHRICKQINRSDTEAGVLFRMAELARVQGETEIAFELAKQAEELSGKELPPLRNRAAALRSQIRGDRRQQIQAGLHQIRIIVTLIIDLAINAPLVLLKSIGYYLLFLAVVRQQKVGSPKQVRIRCNGGCSTRQRQYDSPTS